MANFRVGERVRLRSGKCGTINRIVLDHPMAHLTRYQVAMEPNGQLILINGVDVVELLKPDITGKTLDGYAVTGITYGADRRCRRCLGDPRQHEVFETELSKAAAKVVLDSLMRITESNEVAKLTRGEREARFMFGVLVCPSRQLLAACSGMATPASFKAALRADTRFTLCEDVKRPVLCRGKRGVANGQIGACRFDNVPLACAAPKLVDYANRQGYAMPYHMTEVWFDPKVARWNSKNQEKPPKFTDHGETRTSCETCKRVLPLLLCNAQP